ncbi:DUF397 domain-containing protein [Streptomyces sp. NPDC088725]|uniref:DUF397 domain-containing protein n=1 Tax=Streptomyces sp. NPDC088725 TaxID=3365873 RepID=UPI00381793AA
MGRVTGYTGQPCVEIADSFAGAVPVRDSKDPHGPALLLAPGAWTGFLTHVKTTDA